jgi:DNA polymerase elongation subunit (family B)
MEDEFLIFQVISWNTHEDRSDPDTNFEVRVFGMTQERKTVYLKITGFNPFFYARVPDGWNDTTISEFIKAVKGRVYPDMMKGGLTRATRERAKIFHEFDNYKTHNLVKFEFKNTSSFRAYERVFNRPLYSRKLSNKPKKYELYETNAEPMLRCMHAMNIDACGWMKINKINLKEIDEDNQSYCDYNYSVLYNKVMRHESNNVMPFKVASFDIECMSEEGFPQPERRSDAVIQIGTTYNYYGENTCYYKNIITLGTCDKIDGVDVIECKTEKEVLLEWVNLIKRTNPDIITGYNIFGFDFRYLNERAKLLGIEYEFSETSRIKSEKAIFIKKDLSSSALGENKLLFYDMGGRVCIDMMKVVQRDYKLPAYGLDSVASTFIKETIKIVEPDEENNKTVIITKDTFGLDEDQYISIQYKKGYIDYKFNNNKKYIIKNITKDRFEIIGDIIKPSDFEKGATYSWTQAKDDVKPTDIFKLHEKGGSKGRSIVAKYCIQDCALVNKLMMKLQVITNAVGMANVTSVPIQYLFLRGQGVKIFSLMLKKCSKEGFVMPVIRKKDTNIIEDNPSKPLFKQNDDNGDEGGDDSDDEESIKEQDDEGYEGATVFDPDRGIHYDPIPVLDYSSLYPSSMIHRNISHDCLIQGHKIDKFKNNKDITSKYYINKVEFRGVGENKDKITTCYFVKDKSGKKGIVPSVLEDLLKQRKAVKKLMEAESDPFIKSIFEGLQLAYKLTANSLYGQTGAPTSSIYKREVAASTTATGREMLMYARDFSERIFHKVVLLINDNKKSEYKEYLNRLFSRENMDDGITEIWNSIFGETWIDWSRLNDKKENKYKNQETFIEWFYYDIQRVMTKFRIKPKVMYGDTDSVFIKMNIYDPETNEKQRDHNALAMAIELGILNGILINMFMPPPQDLEYEKTFWPFMIITKKRYVGNLYETDPDKFKEKSMGIVLKRRDNAPIVKLVCGGIVNKILNERSGTKAVEFLKESINDILSGKYDIDKFVVSKSLKTNYKNKTKITHAILADRMGERDPGNKPQSNDRIPFVFIEEKHIKCKISGEPVDINECKCRTCGGTFSLKYLHNHGKICHPRCKITGETDKDKLIFCKTCLCYYQKGDAFFNHLLLPKTDPEEYGKQIFDDIKRQYLNEVNNIISFNTTAYNLMRKFKKKWLLNYYNPLQLFYAIKYYKGHIKLTDSITKEIENLKDDLRKERITFEQFKIEEIKKKDEMNASKNIFYEIEQLALNYEGFDYNSNESKCKNPMPEKILQGDRAETPEFVLSNDLSLDYLYYIKQQIQTPAIQFLELVIKEPEKLFEHYEMIEINRRLGRTNIHSLIKDDEDIELDDFDKKFKPLIKTKDITTKISNHKKKNLISNNNIKLNIKSFNTSSLID